MSGLEQLCTQYELLSLLAHHISTIDLYNTALTCSSLYTIILESPKVFDRLICLCLCDGSGLRARLSNATTKPDSFQTRDLEAYSDVAKTKCDEYGTRPCDKCGVNICEECRVYPRKGRPFYGPCRRPHYDNNNHKNNIICYCWPCDEVVEARVGEEFCECDRYTRWICHACKVRERAEDRVCNNLLFS